MRYLKLYWLFQKLYLKRLLEYRTDFFLGFFASFGRSGIGLLLVWTLFQHTSTLHGWQYHETLAVYGLSLLSASLTSIFTPRLFRLGRDYILGGQLDRVLLRPLDPLFQIIADAVGDEALGGFMAGLLALGVAMLNLIQTLTWLSTLWLVVAILCGALVYFAIMLLSVVVCFWFELPWGVLETTQSLGLVSQYPLDIYHEGIRFVLTWVVPFGFTAFLPAATLLRPAEYQEYFLIIPLYSFSFFACAYAIWRVGVNHYVGAGH